MDREQGTGFAEIVSQDGAGEAVQSVDFFQMANIFNEGDGVFKSSFNNDMKNTLKLKAQAQERLDF